MSNKLHKKKPQIKSKRISVFRIILLVFLIIVFTCILLDIFTKTIRFDKKLDAIVEGNSLQGYNVFNVHFMDNVY